MSQSFDDATATATQAFTRTATDGGSPPIWLLTVMWHPDLDRAGEQVLLPGTGELRVNRYEPSFAPPPAALVPRMIKGTLVPPPPATSGPLGHPGISRSSLCVRVRAGVIDLYTEDDRVRAEVNGVPLQGVRTLTAHEMVTGVVIQLCSRVLLCLHAARQLPVTPDPLLQGVSSAMETLRRQVRRVGPTELPVLIRGESGTGKDLAARALRQHSPRAEKPWVAVNMATLTESLGAAELFGAARGAYTGAQADRAGLWAQAEGGTLFMDEIGDCPVPIQPMLLRVLESGEYRPVGGPKLNVADVRVIAATDRPLDVATFNQPLLRRLQTFMLFTPALRDRREDLGVLARLAWDATGVAQEALAHMPAELARALCLHDWPGNVRQLQQAIRRLAVDVSASVWPPVELLLGETLAPPRPSPAPSHSGLGPQAMQGPAVPATPLGRTTSTSAPAFDIEDDRTGDALDAVPSGPGALGRVSGWGTLGGTAITEEGDAPRRVWRSTAGITEADLLAALNLHGWQLKDAADALGISRPSIYNLMDRLLQLRPAEDWSREELAPLLAEPGQTLAALATKLRIPREALRRRLRALALPRPAEG